MNTGERVNGKTVRCVSGDSRVTHRAVIEAAASLKVTLWALPLLAFGILAAYFSETHNAWLLAAPLAVMSVNLACAIAVNRALRTRAPLLVFHLALIAIVLLVAAGRLTYLKGELELSTGETFEGALQKNESGPWHRSKLADASFTNHGFTIDYAPGVKRGATRNTVSWTDGAGRVQRGIVGDQEPLRLHGYRFYSTPNKGYAPVLTWRDARGASQGTVHLPPYPAHEYAQAVEWTPPGASAPVWLMLDIADPVLDPDKAWRFRVPEKHTLVLRIGEERHELEPGDRLDLAAGTLAYDGLTTWMGYSVFYDWTLPWLLAACLTAVASLAWHYAARFAAQPWDA